MRYVPLAALTWGNLLFSWYQLLLLPTRMQNHKQVALWGFRRGQTARPGLWAPAAQQPTLLPGSRLDLVYTEGQKGALLT